MNESEYEMMKGMKSGECWLDEIEETRELRENPKNPNIAHDNCAPADTETRTQNPNRDRRAV